MPGQTTPKAQIVPVYGSDILTGQTLSGIELRFQNEKDFQTFFQSNRTLPLSLKEKTDQHFIVHVHASPISTGLSFLSSEESGVFQYENGEIALRFKQYTNARDTFISTTGLSVSSDESLSSVLDTDYDGVESEKDYNPILIFNPKKYFAFLLKPIAIKYVNSAYIELEFPEKTKLNSVNQFKNFLKLHFKIFPILDSKGSDYYEKSKIALPLKFEFYSGAQQQFFKKLLGLDENATELNIGDKQFPITVKEKQSAQNPVTPATTAPIAPEPQKPIPQVTETQGQPQPLPNSIKEAVIKKIKEQRGRNPLIAWMMGLFNFKLRSQKLAVTNQTLQYLQKQKNMSFEEFEKLLDRFHSVQAYLDAERPTETSFLINEWMNKIKTPQQDYTIDNFKFRGNVGVSVKDVRRYEDIKKILTR